MVMVRTNLCPDPRYIGVDGKGGGGSASWSQSDVTSGSSDGGGHTRIDVTGTQTGTVEIGTDDLARTPVTAGETYTLSTHANISHRATLTVRAVASWQDATGTPIATTVGGSEVAAPGTAWFRYPVVGATAPEGATQVQVRLRIEIGSAPLDAGDIVRIGQRMVEAGDQLAPYFDGDYLATKYAVYAWTGPVNASPSTETYTGPPSITAELLASSTDPQPVRLVLSNIPAGDSYVVTGIGSGGRTWNVAGGTGVSQGVQIILDDLRAPPNQLIRYRLVVSGTEAGAYDSNTVTVPWAPRDGDSKAVVQSLDGKTVVTLAAWIDNQLPVQPVINTTGFPIRGRARPVMVMATAGAGTMTVIWRLHRLESDKLEKIIADGGGIALRTDGTARDLPISDIAVITGASSALWEADNGISTDRVWELELTWIDDPEPSSVPVIYTVDDVDGILAGKTVDEVDAMFAGQSVDDVDAEDWSTVS